VRSTAPSPLLYLGSAWHLLAERATRIPPLQSWLNHRHKRSFDIASGRQRIFHGIYPDFASAIRDIPPGRLQGHDNEASVLRLADARLRVVPSDYPIMFWLQKLLPACQLLFDLGGGVGISYFGYRKFLQYPAPMTWLVAELPAAVAVGVQIARHESATTLRFTTTLEELPQADILLAAGCLQLIEKPFELLSSVPSLPPHILINKVPLRDLPAAVTLHNTGAAFCAYHLFNRAQFVGAFKAFGYELRDEWAVPELSAHIPYFPDHSIPAYSGFYFAKTLG
jgi:putative methyltransferase (TIGR04325 family)